MIFYFYPTKKFNDGKINLIHTKYQLGDQQFNNFWSEEGLTILGKILNEAPELIEDFTIQDDSKKKYKLDEFLTLLGKLNVITQR